MAYDHAQSPRLGQPTPVENPGVRIVTTETLPEVAYRGQMVYLLDVDKFRVFDGVAWQNPTADITGGTQTFVQATQPTADAVGDLWLNTTNYQLYIWDGTVWKPTIDSAAAKAAIDASEALSAADQALGLVHGKTTIWYTPTQPVLPNESPVTGDYWINTVTNQLYRFTSAFEVVQVQDADIAAALSAAGTAQSTADEKIQSFVQDTAPTGLSVTDIGDLWFDTSGGDGVVVWRWNGTGFELLQTGATGIANNSVSSEHLGNPILIHSLFTNRVVDNQGIPSGIGTDIDADGEFSYDANGDVRFSLPNDPAQTALFRGNAEIGYLTVQTLTTLTNAQLTQGSALTLNNGVSASTNPPTVKINYDSVQFENSPGWGNRVGFDTDGTYFYCIHTNSSGRAYWEKYNAAGSQIGSQDLGTSFNFTGGCWMPVNNNHAATYCGIAQNAAGDWSLVYGCDTTTRPAFLLPSNIATGSRGAALGWDSTSQQFLVAQSRGDNSDSIRISRGSLNSAGSSVSWAVTVNTVYTTRDNLSHIDYGIFDFGANKYILGNFGTSQGLVLDPTTKNLDTTLMWDSGISGAGRRGLTWNGSNFITINSTGLMLTYEGGNRWTATGDSNWFAAYSYTNGSAETLLSPVTAFLMSKRAQVVLSGASLPAGVTGTKFYLAKGTAPNPSVLSMTYQNSTTDSPPSITVGNATFGTLNNPILNGFGEASPASVQSEASDTLGALIALNGIGSGRAGWLRWDRTGKGLTPAIQYVRTTDFTVSNNLLTNIVFNSVENSTGSWSPTSGVLTIPETGLYSITGCCTWNGAATGRRVLAFIAGSTTITRSEITGASSPISNNLATDVYLTSGTQVALQAFQTSGADLALDSTRPNRFTVRRVG